MLQGQGGGPIPEILQARAHMPVLPGENSIRGRPSVKGISVYHCVRTTQQASSVAADVARQDAAAWWEDVRFRKAY
eukprot:scaffold17513_cov14-Tisochrysis_lutea.AAC.1